MSERARAVSTALGRQLRAFRERTSGSSAEQTVTVWRPLGANMPAWLRTVVCACALYLMQWPVSPSSHQDFAPTLIAARMAAEGRWADIYPLPTPEGGAAHGLTWGQTANALGLNMAGVGPFTYHPYYASAASYLIDGRNYDRIRTNVVRLNRFCVVWVAFEVAAMLSISGLAGQLLITLLLAACSPVVSALEFGQNTVIALALSIAALRLWADPQQRILTLLLGSLLAASAWACKPWCVLLLPFCFALRRFKPAAAASACIAATMMLLPYLLYPRVLMEHYTAFMAEASRGVVPGFLNLSLLMSAERLHNPDWLAYYHVWGSGPATPAVRLATLGITALVFLVSALAVLFRRPHASWIIAAALGLMLLPLGIVWTHYFVFAMPVAILGAAAAHDSRLLRVVSLGLLAQVMLLEYWLIHEYQRTTPWPMAVPILSVAVVSMLALWLGPQAVVSASTRVVPARSGHNQSISTDTSATDTMGSASG